MELLEAVREFQELYPQFEELKAKIDGLKDFIKANHQEDGQIENVLLYSQSRTTTDYKGFVESLELEIPAEYIKKTTTRNIKLKK